MKIVETNNAHATTRSTTSLSSKRDSIIEIFQNKRFTGCGIKWNYFVMFFVSLPMKEPSALKYHVFELFSTDFVVHFYVFLFVFIAQSLSINITDNVMLLTRFRLSILGQIRQPIQPINRYSETMDRKNR